MLHRWRVAGALVPTPIAGALAYGATKANAPRRPRVAAVLWARGFEVVNAKGRAAVRLSAEPDGFVWLAVANRAGSTRAALHGRWSFSMSKETPRW